MSVLKATLVRCGGVWDIGLYAVWVVASCEGQELSLGFTSTFPLDVNYLRISCVNILSASEVIVRWIRMIKLILYVKVIDRLDNGTTMAM